MFLVLSDHKKKNLPFNLKVSNKHKKEVDNLISIQVQNIKRKIKIHNRNGKLHATVKVDLKLAVEEYAPDHLFKKSTVENLNEKVEKHLNQLAERTIKKMQKANCDGLGIGQKIKAYHHQSWKSLEWKKVYPDIPIHAEIKTEIVQQGLIN